MRSEARTLADRLRREAAWMGASWMPRLGDEGFALAAKLKGEDLFVSAIGGKVRDRESFLEAARREYREETGREPPAVLLQPEAVLLGSHLEPGEDAEGACVLIQKRPNVALPNPPPLWIAVFAGRIGEDPQPIEKIPTFLIVRPPALEVMARGGWPAGEVRVIGTDVSRARRVVLMDTPLAIAETAGLAGRVWSRSEGSP